MRSFVIAGLAALALCAPARAAPDETPPAQATADPKAEFDAVQAEFGQALKDFSAAFRAAKSDDERRELAGKRPNAATYLQRVLDIVAKAPKDPVAAECHLWIVQNVREPKAQAAALDALLADHLASPAVRTACAGLPYSHAKNAATFLRAVLEKSENRETQAAACYALAKVVQRAGTPEAEKEADALLVRATEQYGDVKVGRRTMAEQAKGDLFEVRSLGIGKTAPEIVGADVDGNPMKLSDFRGKVVVLDFMGFW
jgi:hypothetical protein